MGFEPRLYFTLEILYWQDQVDQYNKFAEFLNQCSEN